MTDIEKLARHAHEVNRAYSLALGDESLKPWEDEPEWLRNSVRQGVKEMLSGTANTPEEQHQKWVDYKVAEGWRFGPVKDPVAKTHPCLLPYAELGAEQRAKDHLFRAAVRGACELLGIELPT